MLTWNKLTSMTASHNLGAALKIIKPCDYKLLWWWRCPASFAFLGSTEEVCWQMIEDVLRTWRRHCQVHSTISGPHSRMTCTISAACACAPPIFDTVNSTSMASKASTSGLSGKCSKLSSKLLHISTLSASSFSFQTASSRCFSGPAWKINAR